MEIEEAEEKARQNINEVFVVVRLMAEGSDWKRDSGETLAQWVERTFRQKQKPSTAILEEFMKRILSIRDEARRLMQKAYAGYPVDRRDISDHSFRLDELVRDIKKA